VKEGDRVTAGQTVAILIVDRAAVDEAEAQVRRQSLPKFAGRNRAKPPNKL